MSHLVETMAYAGETPWHGLGNPVSNDLSPVEMLQAAELDWTVSKRPLFFMHDSKHIKTKQTALVRDSDNSILSYVPDNWNPLQNAYAFDFFREFVEAGEMEMHTAGSLRNGRRVWALAKVNEKFRLRFGKKEDVTELYLLFHSPHEFGKTITVDMTNVRVVCNNTVTLALSKASANIVRISHKNKFDPSVVKETMFLAHENFVEYRERAEFLASRKYKKDMVQEYFGRLFPSYSKKEDNEKVGNKNAELALSVLDTQPGAELGEGTWWQPFNAVTYLMDHKLGRSQENRLNNVWFGTMKDKKVAALNLALEYAEGA